MTICEQENQLAATAFTYKIRNGVQAGKLKECRFIGVSVSKYFGYPIVFNIFPISIENSTRFLYFKYKNDFPKTLVPSLHHFCSSIVRKEVSRVLQRLRP